jgi:ribosome maturation factor RimP
MDKAKLLGIVRPIAQDAAERSGVELYDVKISGIGSKPLVQVFIEKEKGITHIECAEVSRSLDEVLEAGDLIPDAYILEVSSPGIERELLQLSHFEKFAGSLAKVKLKQAINNQKNFRGRIFAVEEEHIIFDDKTNGRVRFPFSEVVNANLEIDLIEEFKNEKK